MTTYSESRRQIVHMAMGAISLLLPFLTWPQAALLAVAALVFNAFALARVMPGIIRPTDAGGHRAGVLFYPLSVLLLILVFRDRLDLVAMAWAVMALGDGAATIVGTSLQGPRLPWNDQKTWTGLAGFIIAGSAGAMALSVWMASPMGLYTGVAAATAAAFVETIPITLDDNLSVPFAAGLTLALLSMGDPRAIEPRPFEVWALATVVNVVMAGVAWFRGSLTFTGCVVGALLGMVIYVAGGVPAWALLFLAFALAVISSRAGRGRKAALGIGEAHGDRRGAGNAIANCLVGAIGGWLMMIHPVSTLGELVLITGLVAGASDTVASEFGKAFGGAARAFPSLRVVPAGTPGAVTVVGTLAGLVSAAAMAIVAGWLMPQMLAFAPFVVIGATFGAFLESALATRFETRGILNNDMLNFINTAAAAAVAIGSWRVVAGG